MEDDIRDTRGCNRVKSYAKWKNESLDSSDAISTVPFSILVIDMASVLQFPVLLRMTSRQDAGTIFRLVHDAAQRCAYAHCKMLIRLSILRVSLDAKSVKPRVGLIGKVTIHWGQKNVPGTLETLG